LTACRGTEIRPGIILLGAIGTNCLEEDLFDLDKNPDALRVCKRPVAVEVEFAAADGTCKTLEGQEHYQAGDALLTGVRGEHWPIRRALFGSSYEPIAPTRAGENGRYRKLPALAHALRLTESFDIPASGQRETLHGRPGDWLLRYADGSFGIVWDDIFRETYAPAAGETRWSPA
jgi:PGDYG protein